jgi:hypothetical protein
MKVMVLSQIRDEGPVWRSDDSDLNWFLNKLKLEPQKTEFGSRDHAKNIQVILEAVDKLSEVDLAKLIVEFCLSKLTYKGDIKQYKIQTTESLNWLGIGVTTHDKDSS